jgi:hypothetical protein
MVVAPLEDGWHRVVAVSETAAYVPALADVQHLFDERGWDVRVDAIRCGDHEVVHQQVADRVSRIAALSLRPASLLRNAFLAMAGRRALARELGDR